MGLQPLLEAVKAQEKKTRFKEKHD